jgi:hypothetical protein
MQRDRIELWGILKRGGGGTVVIATLEGFGPQNVVAGATGPIAMPELRYPEETLRTALVTFATTLAVVRAGIRIRSRRFASRSLAGDSRCMEHEWEIQLIQLAETWPLAYVEAEVNCSGQI